MCGREGTGIIREVGKGVPKEYIGRKAAFCVEVDKEFNLYTPCTSWGEYTRVHSESVMLLGEDAHLGECVGAMGHGLMALGVLGLLGGGGLGVGGLGVGGLGVGGIPSTSILYTHSGGAFGGVLTRLSVQQGIHIVYIVTHQSMIPHFLHMGVDPRHIFHMGDPALEEKLTPIIHSFDISLCFDTVGGPLTARLLSLLPLPSTLYFSPLFLAQHIILTHSNIQIFQLMDAQFMLTHEGRANAYSLIAQSIHSHEEIFNVKVGKIMKLEDHQEIGKEDFHVGLLDQTIFQCE